MTGGKFDSPAALPGVWTHCELACTAIQLGLSQERFFNTSLARGSGSDPGEIDLRHIGAHSGELCKTQAASKGPGMSSQRDLLSTVDQMDPSCLLKGHPLLN